MARTEGGPGPGVTKGKTSAEQAAARAAAKQRKQTRKVSKGMHATTLADSALENDLILAEDRLADAFDMAQKAIEEYAAHTLRRPTNGTTRTRYDSLTVEGMTALLYYLFDDTADNLSDTVTRPIPGQPTHVVQRLFVFACEVHNLRKLFQSKYDWYRDFSQDKLLRREVAYRRDLLRQAEANAA